MCANSARRRAARAFRKWIVKAGGADSRLAKRVPSGKVASNGTGLRAPSVAMVRLRTEVSILSSFHPASAQPSPGEVFLDLVLEECDRRRRGHEAAVHLAGDAFVLHHAAVAELDLEGLGLRVVTDTADLRGTDAL